ncbi:MAG: envelope biogenesis factor ElyC [Candidatus Pelagadaptatus aseana]|uniref:ElyC/SanA/YdcF family protein n=1 Tax=Candidatus Pelagadaptatus aseana TaxID=3120508 RepID=UPI0039B1FF50
MEFGFLLKKIIGNLLMPWPFFLCLLLCCLCFKSLRQRLGAIALGGICVLALLTITPVGFYLFSDYERQYRSPDLALPENQVQWIVVLGGGVHRAEPGQPALAQLGVASLARLSEGIRLQRLLPESRLLLSGSGVFNAGTSSAEVYFRAAQELGLAADVLQRIEQPMDTESEAAAIESLVGDQPFLLVTSASHMPRAMRLMTARGLKAIAAPANRDYHPSPDHWLFYLPDERNFYRLRAYWHERLGQWWLDLKAWLGS